MNKSSSNSTNQNYHIKNHFRYGFPQNDKFILNLNNLLILNCIIELYFNVHGVHIVQGMNGVNIVNTNFTILDIYLLRPMKWIIRKI